MDARILLKRQTKRKSLADKMLSEIEAGKGFSEIADSNGISLNWARKLLIENFGRSYIKLREEAFKEGIKLVESGELYSFELRQRFEISPRTFYQELAEYGKRHLLMQESEKRPLPENRFGDLINSLDEQTDYDLNLSLLCGDNPVDIAKKRNVKRQFIDTYLLGAGLHSIWKERHKKISKETEQALDLARNTDLSAMDLVYFLDLSLSDETVQRRLRGRKNRYKLGLHLGPHIQASYADASRVYQAVDSGLKGQDLLNLFPKLKQDVVSKLLIKRNSIEPKIISNIRIIYQNPEITTPYFYPGAKR